MVDLFHWSLNDIDATDIESLIPFVTRYPKWKAARGGQGEVKRKVYADEVEL